MNIDDIQNKLGTIDSSPEKILPELLTLAIYNNSLLRVILANQATINNKLDPSITVEAFEQSYLDLVTNLAQEKNIKILLKLSI